MWQKTIPINFLNTVWKTFTKQVLMLISNLLYLLLLLSWGVLHKNANLRFYHVHHLSLECYHDSICYVALTHVQAVAVALSLALHLKCQSLHGVRAKSLAIKNIRIEAWKPIHVTLEWKSENMTWMRLHCHKFCNTSPEKWHLIGDTVTCSATMSQCVLSETSHWICLLVIPPRAVHRCLFFSFVFFKAKMFQW